jgi:hypothetical protein
LSRRELPATRAVTTIYSSLGDVRVKVWTATDQDRGVLDVAASYGPPGNSQSAALGTVCELMSFNLERGVPLEVHAAFCGQKCEPCGPTDDPLVPECSSVMDYVFRAVMARRNGVAQ